MIESAVVLTPLHYAYLIGVIVILAVMVLKKDTPAVCIAFLFTLFANMAAWSCLSWASSALNLLPAAS